MSCGQTISYFLSFTLFSFYLNERATTWSLTISHMIVQTIHFKTPPARLHCHVSSCAQPQRVWRDLSIHLWLDGVTSDLTCQHAGGERILRGQYFALLCRRYTVLSVIASWAEEPGVWICSRFISTGEFFLPAAAPCFKVENWLIDRREERHENTGGSRPTLRWWCRCSCWGRFSATDGRTSRDWAWARWRAATWFGRCSPLHWRTRPRKRDKVWERWRWSERAPARGRETAFDARTKRNEINAWINN